MKQPIENTWGIHGELRPLKRSRERKEGSRATRLGKGLPSGGRKGDHGRKRERDMSGERGKRQEANSSRLLGSSNDNRKWDCVRGGFTRRAARHSKKKASARYGTRGLVIALSDRG